MSTSNKSQIIQMWSGSKEWEAVPNESYDGTDPDDTSYLQGVHRLLRKLGIQVEVVSERKIILKGLYVVHPHNIFEAALLLEHCTLGGLASDPVYNEDGSIEIELD